MNQMFKKASSVFTAIVCAASITFSGASLVLADGEIDEQTKTTIETTAEGLTNTIIPLTEDEIAAYMESGDAFTENAMTAWDSAREDLGDLKKAGSAEIEYSNDEYTATVPVEFEKEDAEFIYVFDKNLTPTSLSVDVKYSFATTMKNAALNTIMGLGTVFVILIMLIFLISLFQFIPGSGAQEAKAKKKAAEEAVERFREVCPDASFAVGECMNGDPFELALALVRYGFQVPEIYGTITAENFVYIRHLAELSPDTKVFSNMEPTMLYYDPSGSGVNLTIGKDAGYYHRDQPNAVWNQDRQPYGYAGVRRLFETLTEKVLQKGEKV